MVAVLVTAVIALLVILAIVWVFLRALDAARQAGEIERSLHIEHVDRLYADHRAEIRELLNRYQFPTIMPTTRHAAPVAAPAPGDSIRERQRRAWLGVGHAEPLAVAPDVNGTADDELGNDVP